MLKLKDLQNVEIEILDQVVGICEKHNLTYYLAYGTLLGAVRHQGFIPWDDDIDIMMPRKDYVKFSQIAQKELGDKYFYQSVDTEKDYINPYAKVRKNSTLFVENGNNGKNINQGIFIDIFPMDCTSSSDLICKLKIKYVNMLMQLMGYNIQKTNYYSKKIKFLSKFIKMDKIKAFKKYNKLVNKSTKGNKYISYGVGHFKEVVFDKMFFRECVEIQFGNRKYSSPAGYDGLLKSIYGDYMKLPPVEERVNTHNPIIIFDNEE